jgi:hypothetical protein
MHWLIAPFSPTQAQTLSCTFEEVLVTRLATRDVGAISEVCSLVADRG